MTTRTYILAGGGTGGHLYPGIAVAQELMRRQPSARIIFVGSEREVERTILAKYPFAHRSLTAESFSTAKRHPLRFLLRNWRALHEARRMLREEKPAAVIGLGGYASAPLVWSAARSRIPVILLEQNVIPGRTTRWLSRLANAVCTPFKETSARIPRSANVQLTGNPVRPEIATIHSTSAPVASIQLRELLILGGSQGADSLNDSVIEAVRLLCDDLSGYHIVHQTGPRQADSIRRAYAELQIVATVEPFFDDVLTRYRAAFLVISRAGATTLAELCCCGLPMVLLPYPHAADDHQRANALSLQNHGAALVVEHQSTARETGLVLADSLRSLMLDPSRRVSIGKAALSLAKPAAAMSVVDCIESLLDK